MDDLEILEKLIDNIQKNLKLIQKEKTKLNENALPLKAKKKITDESFQKIIKLKNIEVSKVLAIQNKLMGLVQNLDDKELERYQNFGVEKRISKMNKLFDDTFSVVEEMKREIELAMSSEGSGPIESSDEDRSFYTDETEATAAPTTPNKEYIQEVFGDILKKALVSVILYQPNDPIEYLAKYLLQYRKNELSKNAKVGGSRP